MDAKILRRFEVYTLGTENLHVVVDWLVGRLLGRHIAVKPTTSHRWLLLRHRPRRARGSVRPSTAPRREVPAPPRRRPSGSSLKEKIKGY